MKRLLFISNLFPDRSEPYRGLDNATALHHLANQWEVRAIALRPTLPFRSRARTPRALDEPFQPEFVSIPYVPRIGSRFNHLLMARALRAPLLRIQGEFPFDAALSSWIYPDSCAVSRLSRELGFPFVAIAQGSDVHQYLRTPVRRRIIQSDLPAASAVITRSAELARLLAEAGLPQARLHPVYNGIDFNLFRPADRSEARRFLTVPAHAPLALFVGNFYPIKNPLLLIEAFAAVCREPAWSEARLAMVGGGPLEDDARGLAAKLGVERNVIFAGRQDAAAVARWMQAADTLVLPSANEGVPNVILEAFACGLPVVASRVGGISEVHAGDAFGRLVPAGDAAALTAALRGVFRTPPAREPIAAHGKTFAWERTAAAYDALLREAITAAANR